MEDFRLESDSVGELEIPVNAYYGVQSLRGKNNFPITGRAMHRLQIDALAEIKQAAAISNFKTGFLAENIKDVIVDTCKEILSGKFYDEFIIDPIQGGAGTSANMNANEVIANRANEALGGKLGDYDLVNPNDHVNMSQSTNDVYPTSGKIAALRLIECLIAELDKLVVSFEKKAVEFNNYIAMGRTQLQDAVPIRIGQSFEAFAAAIRRDIQRLNVSKQALYPINMGGTAIGTGINASKKYINAVSKELSEITNLPLVKADNLIDATQNLDCFVEVSGTLKAAAVNLSKISNDLRLLSSGPRTGIFEINLPPKQNGSSIMPGKVNPVIPEVVSQVAFLVIGNDFTITMAAEAGQLQLNAFEPVLFYNLFESIETLTNSIYTLRVNCIDGITVNAEHARELAENSIGIITAITPKLGYKKAASIAKQAMSTGVSVKSLLESTCDLTPKEISEILDPFTMTEPLDD